MENSAEETAEKQGKWYWFKHNLKKHLKDFAARHKLASIIVVALIIFLVFALRALYHPYIIRLRELSFPIISAVVAFSIFRIMFGEITALWKALYAALLIIIPIAAVYESISADIPHWLIGMELGVLVVMAILILLFFKGFASYEFKGRAILLCILAAIIFCTAYLDADPHQYLAFYYRYKTLDIVQLDKDPVTDHERIQPLMMIHKTGQTKLDMAEHLATPDFVRSGGDYRFTMSIEPKYIVGRFKGRVKQLFNVSATTPAPSFSKREKVSFNVGENLLLSNNSYANACKSMGLLRYLNYQPMDVKYIMNNTGEWVQVITLVRFRGLIFPYPEFGGVHVISQSRDNDTTTAWWQRALVGSGAWVPPSEISKHAYLKGQSIISFRVSRYMARSFRFQNSFLAPMPYYHIGDIRIPDLPGDRNDQPFTTFWDMRSNDADDGLYHYFSMEPFAPDKSGLNTSIFVPADGSNTTYIIRHSEREEGLTGVTPIADIVKDSKKNYDWKNTARPVEQRPYWKIIDGEVRKFWLTTVVSFAEAAPDSDAINTSESSNNTRTVATEQFASSSIPEIVLTDPSTHRVIWVRATDPDTWEETIKSEMASIWKDNDEKQPWNSAEGIKEKSDEADSVNTIKEEQ